MRLMLFVAFLAISKGEKNESADDEESAAQLELLKTDLKEDQVAQASSYPTQKYLPPSQRHSQQKDGWRPPDFTQINPINNFNFQQPGGSPKPPNFNIPQNSFNFPQNFPGSQHGGFPSFPGSGSIGQGGIPSFPGSGGIGQGGIPSFPGSGGIGHGGIPSFPGSGGIGHGEFPSFPGSGNNIVGPVNNFHPQNFWKPGDEPAKDYVQTSTAAPQNNYPSQSQNNYQQPQSDYVPPQNNYYPPPNNYYPPANNYYPTTQPPTTPQVPVIKNEHVIGENGNYRYEYQIGDGTHVGEEGYVTNPKTDAESIVKRGWYSYVGADGVRYTVKYWADDTGFHAEGDHLPKAPPVPPAIQASIEQNQREEAEKNKYTTQRPYYPTTAPPHTYYPTTQQPTYYPQQNPQQTYYPQQNPQQTYYPQQNPQQSYYPQQNPQQNNDPHKIYYPQQ